MHIVRLASITSTNDFLKGYIRDETNMLLPYTVIVADKQTQGKGQRGTYWESESGKNLTFSIYDNQNLLSQSYFKITMAISIAVLKTIETLRISNLSIKWPNDIYYKNTKLCGILIESMSMSSSDMIDNWIVGVGLNVHQTDYRHAENATSLIQITSKQYDLEELMIQIVDNYKKYTTQQTGDITSMYERYLYKKDEVHCFKSVQNIPFNGMIMGVSALGKLEVLGEDECVEQYDIKEIKY